MLKQMAKLIYFILLLKLSVGCGKDTKDPSPDPASTSCTTGESCLQRPVELNVSNISEASGQRSHNHGENCFSCHQERGLGKGIFTLAGSLFRTSGSAHNQGVIRIYNDAARTELAIEVPVDGLGNFFTTETLEFPSAGFFVSVLAANGTEIRMRSPKLSLACNQCHAGNFRLEAP